MFVIEVIPLRRGIAVESLSYYAKSDVSIGTIVQIPIRGKVVPGIVITSQPVSTAKTVLKNATFTLRKLPKQQHNNTLPRHLISLANELKRTYPATVGAMLYALLPKDVADGSCTYETHNIITGDEDYTPQTVQATNADRYTIYQSHVRTTFARSGSILCIVPTAADVPETAARLSTGIEDRTVCLSPHLTKQSRIRNWKKIQKSAHPLLIVTTPTYAQVDRGDIQSILVEQAGSSHYTQRTRPHLDYRLIFIELAKLTKRSLIFGDSVIRTEQEYLRRNDAFQSYDETPKRLIFSSRIRVLQHTKDIDSKSPFPLFVDETIDRLRTALNKRENVFLYAARRGLAPVIACFDCGNIIRCPDSGNPYSLLKTKTGDTELRWFVDSTSGKRVRAADTCDVCGSWRLRERGIGIQQLETVLPDHFPNTEIICFDSTTATTAKKAHALQTQMREAKGAIFLGTALALPYLTANIAVSCITSLEAAQSIPSWRADEMLFKLLLELREKSTKEVIIQTRSEISDVITHASRGALEKFYDEEIALREMLHYPPFSTLILLSWSGTKEAVLETETQIKRLLKTSNPHFYSHPLSHSQKLKRYALLRITQSDWPNPALLTELQTLPPHITIEVNPDRIV